MNVQTLVLANLIWMLCALGALVCFGRMYPQAAGVAWFTRCVLCLTAAAACIAGVGPGGAERHGAWLALGNGLLVLGFVFFNQGIVIYKQRPGLRLGWHAAGVAVLTAGYYACTGAPDHLGARAVIVGTGLAAEAGWGTWLFARERVRAGAWALGSFAAFNLLRGPITWLEQSRPQREYWVLAATDIGFLLFGGILSLALVWMVIVDLRAHLYHLARTDDLTGLLNRRALETEAGRLPEGAAALVLLDLDHFKQINDRHGHGAGDAALQAVARHLREAIAGNGIARPGGEEFVVLLPGQDGAAAMAAAEKIRQGIAGLEWGAGAQRFTITASLGVATREGQESWPEWLQRADQALYAAKQAGRNCVRLAGKGGECARSQQAGAIGD